jgi:hypothetical protein
MFRSSYFKGTLGVFAVVVLTACGSDGSSPEAPKVATEDAEVQVTASTIPVLYTAPMTFSSGVAALGTTTPTTLSFSANSENAAVPLFSVKTATDSASGTTTFGSCIFTISASTYVPPALLVVGATIEVTPCEVVVETSGKPVGDNLANVTGTFNLGTAEASVALPEVKIDATTGVVTVGTVVVGTVDVGTVTGGQ